VLGINGGPLLQNGMALSVIGLVVSYIAVRLAFGVKIPALGERTVRQTVNRELR
jgi:hypothetical protein